MGQEKNCALGIRVNYNGVSSTFFAATPFHDMYCVYFVVLKRTIKIRRQEKNQSVQA